MLSSTIPNKSDTLEWLDKQNQSGSKSDSCTACRHCIEQESFFGLVESRDVFLASMSCGSVTRLARLNSLESKIGKECPPRCTFIAAKWYVTSPVLFKELDYTELVRYHGRENIGDKIIIKPGRPVFSRIRLP